MRVGIDTGGTFTDVVAIDERGRVVTTKTPSTPADPSAGFLTALRKAVDLLGGDAITAVCHGTTVATNALLQERFDGLGLVTTEGFRHVLEIARQSVPDGYGNSYFWVKPDRIVPLDLVREVGERLDAAGAVVRELDDETVAAAARWFRDHGVDSVGVCLLHAYANPDHERRVREIILRDHPACWVSISSDVLPEYREYERTVTTLIDAAVKPRVAAYVDAVQSRLAEVTGSGVPFWVMTSNGGVLSARQVARQPITTVLSGPAAGALGAAHVARGAGFDRLLTLDGGGTSTDVSVLRDGRPALTTEGSVGRFPVKVPMVDVVTVGTGGGSVAWRSAEGGLKVGPRSAGADPGPLSYGKGGEEPTVTDAAALLGHLPDHLLGGEISLDLGAARAGIERLAASLRLPADGCAAGVLEIAAWNQANALRGVTVRKGLDVRDFALVAFGGSGPLLACRLLDVLGLRAVIVPRDPGNLSAYGLLTVDVRVDGVRTAVARHADLDPAAVQRVWDELAAEAAATLLREGFAVAQQRFARAADLRYEGQAFEVPVAAPDGVVDAALADAVVATFHDEHERLYGYCYRDDPARHIEWVNLRVTGVGPVHAPALPLYDADDGDGDRALTGRRRARFADAWADVPIYDRAKLRAGDRVQGPAVVEEFGSTLPLLGGFVAEVDRACNLVVTARR